MLLKDAIKGCKDFIPEFLLAGSAGLGVGFSWFNACLACTKPCGPSPAGLNWEWCCKSANPGLRRRRQKDQKLKIIFSYIKGLRPAWAVFETLSQKFEIQIQKPKQEEVHSARDSECKTCSRGIPAVQEHIANTWEAEADEFCEFGAINVYIASSRSKGLHRPSLKNKTKEQNPR